jgi:glycosyltransferase involved in cell wall biosynthesis
MVPVHPSTMVRIDGCATVTTTPMSRKLRLAVVSPFVDKRHGTERRVAECISRLADDFEIHVYSNRVGDVPLEKIHWRRIPAWPGPHLFAYLWWFAANHLWRWWDKSVRGICFDLVYSPGINCMDADAITVHVVFSQLLRRTRDDLRLSVNPISSWPRMLHRRLYYCLIAALERRVYTCLNASVAAISKKVAAELAGEFGRGESIPIIYHGTDTDAFNPELRCQRRAEVRRQFGLADAELVLLLIGNGWSNKGLPCLIEAIGSLRNIPVKLLIVGRDDRTPYLERARRISIRERLLFLDPSPDVMRFYAACDVYTGPSLQDSFAQPPAEAMACGLPVITSRDNGTTEIISDRVDGLILQESSDANSLAALIRELYLNPALRQRIGEAAAKTAARFTWEENARQMKKFLVSAAATKEMQ